MQVGAVIRKYRKDKNMTQEEMAKRLGVTAPAVNKWENDNSLPDITLLSPIARLLNISLDILLSHEKELSDAKANQLLKEALERLKTEPFEDVFQWMKQCILEYPNCYYLMLWMPRVLGSQRQMMGLPDIEQYDDYMLDCYKRVLGSGDERTRNAAAESLYNFYMNKKEYTQAEEYLNCFSPENPERKRKQAILYSKTDRLDDAHKAFEELLYAGYQSLNMTFHNLYILALEENDLDKARMLVEKMHKLASIFEFGEYHQISPALELATLEQNKTETLHIMERLLKNVESIYDFAKSPLYSHMNFRMPNEDYVTEIRESLLKGFRDEETYAYLKEDKQWRALLGLPTQ